MQVFTTTASLGAFAADKGQGACAAVAKAANCSGIEIRRELFGTDIPDLGSLGGLIKQEQLTCVYSAPVELWLEDGSLNIKQLDAIIPEALAIGAVLVKTSLGHYRPGESDLTTLKSYWTARVPKESALNLTVENDQTLHGGNVNRLQKFFEESRAAGITFGMTFDIGNWNWTGEDSIRAAEALGGYVVYIHFKHVEKDGGKLVTLPLPALPDSLWRRVLALLPHNVPRTIEFPVQGEDLTAALRQYTQMIAEA